MMKSKYWLTGWLFIVVFCLGMIGYYVYKVDPFMHFHKPQTDVYFYTLDNPRSQNDGIIKYFEYDAIITGTSMTENFKTTEMDKIFGCTSVKVPFAGASYRVINSHLQTAVEYNPDLKIVVRSLDMGMFFDNADDLRDDLENYPTYLYDKNLFNDVQYIWNRDVIWSRVYSMATENDRPSFRPGITSFDQYRRWQNSYKFGQNTVCPYGLGDVSQGTPIHLTESEKEQIRENILQNVTNLAKENPNISFYYFITPYSVIWWMEQFTSGTIYRQLEAEQYIIELILECPNIKLFSFNNILEITTDLNNYKDTTHYASWVNSLLLQWMHDGKCRITKENYLEYLDEELKNYVEFNYDSIKEQDDYENDLYAAALLHKKATGTEPVCITEMSPEELHLQNAFVVRGDTLQIECSGSLEREEGSNISAFDYIKDGGYIGAEVNIPSIDQYGYLSFKGKKISGRGQPSVYVINAEGIRIRELSVNYDDIDNEWHQYVIDLTDAEGSVTIIFNGGYTDNTGGQDSRYVFGDIMLY